MLLGLQKVTCGLGGNSLLYCCSMREAFSNIESLTPWLSVLSTSLADALLGLLLFFALVSPLMLELLFTLFS